MDGVQEYQLQERNESRVHGRKERIKVDDGIKWVVV